MSDPLLESSDSTRHARPLKYVQKVTFKQPFKLELGGHLPEVTVAYETFGELNSAKDNAVLIGHALSGDSHVAQHNPEDDPGWWDIMVGPGKPVDTNRFFVVCQNLLGGCRGTTGPGCINPATGRPYGPDFPTITVNDMVEAQRMVLEHLGIHQLTAVVGGSIGGHQALTWAIRYPERVKTAVLLATSPRLTSQALAFDVVGRNAIRRDPYYNAGQYYDQKHGPEVGLAIARMIGHITYLSREAMTQKFEATRLKPRDVATEFEKIFSVGSYLGHQGTKFVERFDANSYITLSMALDLFDLGNTTSKLAETLKPARCRWLVLSFSSDWLFPPDQSQDLVAALLRNKAQVSYCNVQSSCGHDAFLVADDFARYGEMVRAFMDQLLPPDAKNAGKTPEEVAASDPTSIFHLKRLDYDRIYELVPPGASVLDLGCGTGRLLARLKAANHRRLLGVELDEQKIIAGLRRSLDIIQTDLNKGLRGFAENEFDCVVLSQTLQAVLDVDGVIAEMLRVGKTCIVSFPNFAFRKLRHILAEEGRAPRSYGYGRDEWYNTPDLRFLSISDFEEYCGQKDIRIQRRIALDIEGGTEVFKDPNLNANLAIFVISRQAPS